MIIKKISLELSVTESKQCDKTTVPDNLRVDERKIIIIIPRGLEVF